MEFMSGTILIADDSVTIQKVIEMTLSSEDYDLESCLNEEELFQKLSSSGYDLIVMDFNLSIKKTGIEIAEEISRISPGTPVMAMMGTFDSIDEASLEKAQISEKIIKPFNSKEFVEKCSKLLRKDNETDINDTWSINGLEEGQKFQEQKDDVSFFDDDFLTGRDRLQQEVRDWGVGVPEVIGDMEINTAMESLPAIIEKEESISQEKVSLEDNFDTDVEKFWSVDESNTDEDLKREVTNEKKPRHFAEDISIEQIQDSLRPALEEIIKKYCSQKVEEVAWEIIPDLAENLIRSEIKEISNRLSGK